ncbi:hypothetical protein AB395_00002025 [Sinorhizobium fredii CCBAU 45436]|nr:hypothetical protein AB395_00002025 [Sinorhizobium fredii CCBAU 45436]
MRFSDGRAMDDIAKLEYVEFGKRQEKATVGYGCFWREAEERASDRRMSA